MFGRLLGWYIIYTFSGALAPDRVLPDAVFTLCPRLAFSYIMAALLHGTPAAASAKLRRGTRTEWNYGTFAEGAAYIRLDSQSAITFGIGHILDFI